MSEQLLKLTPNRDLQCFFYQPSAIAALSNSSPNGFTLSGTWRQQFDWAVVEWNRDNVYEHPSIRYLPDGDLSGLSLSYLEQRTACVPFESNLYPSLEWPYLRIWAADENGENVYFVKLRDHAVPADGSYVNATATMVLAGTVSPGRVGLAFEGTFSSAPDPSEVSLEQHYYYEVQNHDTLASVAAGIVNAINSFSPDIQAHSTGTSIVCTYRGTGNVQDKTGANANRITLYGFTQSGSTVGWIEPAATFSGGSFPQRYRIALDFGSLQGHRGTPEGPLVNVPMNKVRKMRWTWAADRQTANFSRTEFQVLISDWQVTGGGRAYFVAGPGSRRIEDDDPTVLYSSNGGVSDWVTPDPGNYSGSRIRFSQKTGATCTLQYSEPAQHQLYLGTRLLAAGAAIQVAIDGDTPQLFSLATPGEDVLIRLPLGSLSAGRHTVILSHVGGPSGSNPDALYSLFFDFLEIAYRSLSLPEFSSHQQLSLATDWDTLHSQALPAERTAWMIWKLGFHGRVNHYMGALWYYELFRPGHQYASTQATVNVTAGDPSGYTELDIGTDVSRVTIQHLNLPDDTNETIAQAIAALINQGTNAIWASVQGNVITITACSMGTAGDGLTISAPAISTNVTVSLSSATLTGGVDGLSVGFDPNDPNAVTIDAFTQFWRTDLSAMPRLNRACRDWSRAFFGALVNYGMDCVAAFSTELAHVDPRTSVGMAQRYSDGSPVVLNTPAIQTNFSPISIAFWTQLYLDIAELQASAGQVPYVQSGEVQWWYFPKTKWNRNGDQWVNVGDAGVGMPFYDDYTRQQFAAIVGRTLPVLQADADPSNYPSESAFLSGLLGEYTRVIRMALQAAYPGARYEILYPTDTNATPLNRVVNYADSDWVPANLNCLKTESFTYTYARNLDLSLESLRTSAVRGFSNSQRSHLVGIGDAKTGWIKEVDLAQSDGLESVVLFALDQFCLIGYPTPPFYKQRRSLRVA